MAKITDKLAILLKNLISTMDVTSSNFYNKKCYDK